VPNTGWCQFWDPTAVFDAQSGHVLLLAAFASSVGTTAATSNNSVYYLWRSTDLGRRFLSARRILTQSSTNRGTTHRVLA
jgi:hypothetical protein